MNRPPPGPRQVEGEYRNRRRGGRSDLGEFVVGVVGQVGWTTARFMPPTWLARWATTRRVVDGGHAQGRVSMPRRIWKADIGERQAPKSRRPSRRARSRKAATVDSSAKFMPWKPA